MAPITNSASPIRATRRASRHKRGKTSKGAALATSGKADSSSHDVNKFKNLNLLEQAVEQFTKSEGNSNRCFSSEIGGSARNQGSPEMSPSHSPSLTWQQQHTPLATLCDTVVADSNITDPISTPPYNGRELGKYLLCENIRGATSTANVLKNSGNNPQDGAFSLGGRNSDKIGHVAQQPQINGIPIRSNMSQTAGQPGMSTFKRIEKKGGNDTISTGEHGKDILKMGNKHEKRIVLKGPWTALEDQQLGDLVKRYGPKQWKLIASHLPNRIAKQV
jgi:hypothetical protein